MSQTKNPASATTVTVKSQEEVTQKLRESLPFLQQKFKVTRIGLFGSYAQGQAKTESDVDILVEFSEPVGWEYVDLHQYLEDILESRIDLVTPAGLKPQLRDKILNSVVYV